MKKSIIDYPEFCDALRNNEIVFLFGTGISSSLTGKLYSWYKWIVDGIDRLKDLEIAQTLKEKLQKDSSTDNMIFVVGEVIRQAKDDGVYDDWMKNSFEKNQIANEELVRTLKKITAINDVIATTNYDLLLENATGLRSVSYEQPDQAFFMLDQKRADTVIHIHGIYDSNHNIDSIIASKSQYERVLNDKGAQFIQHILGTRTLIFVGCGKTTEDVNVSQFVEFAKKYLKLERPYFFLFNEKSPIIGLPDNISPVPYGDEYNDLPAFLEDMIQERIRAKIGTSNLIGRTIYTNHSTDIYGLAEYHYTNEYLKFCGRKKELGQLKAFLEQDTETMWWAITGQAGSGKSRLAYELMKKVPAGYFAFFLNPSANLEDVKRFKPFSDTLVIVDYVLGNESHIANIINGLLEKFKDGNSYKLRLLLLERENLTISGSWFNNLEQSFHYGDRIRFRNAEYRVNPSTAHDFLYINDLDDDAVLELIDLICVKAGLPTDTYRAQKLKNLYERKYEQLRFRPLFLQIFVQAWIENGQVDIDYHGYNGLLDAVLEKEKEHFLNFLGQSKKCVASLINLLVRASIVPIHISSIPTQYILYWQEIEQYVKQGSLPGIERLERIKSVVRDASHAITSCSEELVIDPRYPDIIKEAMFLRFVDDYNEFGEELWNCAPNEYAMFLYRCMVDFPDAIRLFEYIRKVTSDYINIPAMRSRLALLKHEIITAEDNPVELNQIVDEEFAFWKATDKNDATLQDIRIEGLNAVIKQYLGWSREKEAFQAIDELAESPGIEALQEKKCRYLLEIISYLTHAGAYRASERVNRILLKIIEKISDSNPQAHFYQLQIKSYWLLNFIGLIRHQDNLSYRESDWDAAENLRDQLTQACDLTVTQDAEIYTYTLAECVKLCVEKFAGGRTDDYYWPLQDYAESWAQDKKVAFNDRIHYNYLRGKFYHVKLVCVSSVFSFQDAFYASSVANQYVDEVSGNIMIRDFAGLLVGGWAMKVAFDETVTDEEIQKLIQQAEKLLDEYSDSAFLSAMYMDLIWSAATEQHKRKITKAETERCYPLLLRFPDDRDVLYHFFKLLQDSAECSNWLYYVRNKQIANGLIKNCMMDYLYGPPVEENYSVPFVRNKPKVGMNDKCPCGSGKKFKKCCRGNGKYD